MKKVRDEDQSGGDEEMADEIREILQAFCTSVTINGRVDGPHAGSSIVQEQRVR